MHEEAFDTRVPLEWDSAGLFWTFPLLEQSWAEFRGLISNEGSEFKKIPQDNFQIERNASGHYRIIWTATEVDRPKRLYGLVAVRPKSPGTFLGIPLALLIPVVTALASVGGTLAVQSSNDLSKKKQGDETAATPAHADELQYCKASEATLRQFVIPRSPQDRINYLLGKSHGERLEILKRLHTTNQSTRDLARDAEEDFVNNVLAGDSSDISFNKGKNSGQEEVLRVLGLGEPKILRGEDVQFVGGGK